MMLGCRRASGKAVHSPMSSVVKDGSSGRGDAARAGNEAIGGTNDDPP